MCSAFPLRCSVAVQSERMEVVALCDGSSGYGNRDPSRRTATAQFLTPSQAVSSIGVFPVRGDSGRLEDTQTRRVCHPPFNRFRLSVDQRSAFCPCLPVLCWSLRLLFPIVDSLSRTRKDRGASIALSAIYAAYIHGVVFALPGNHFTSGLGVHEPSFPVRACDHLEPREGMRLYNSFSTGGYVVWRFREQIRVFQDGRIHAYPKEWFQRIEEAKNDPSSWTRLLDESGINVALVSKNEDPPHFWESLKDARWRTLFEDDGFYLGESPGLGRPSDQTEVTQNT
jgi:hypothetical protein